MLKITICLLLVTGVFSLLDEPNLENVIKPDKVQDADQHKDTDSSKTDDPVQQNVVDADSRPATPKPKTKLPPQLNQEQINTLAEKVLRIHGVQPDVDDEDNQKNIDELRKVVANVEKNLNEKLKLTKTQVKEKNPSTVPEIKDPTPEGTTQPEENEVSNKNVGEVSPNNDGGNESVNDAKPSELTSTEKAKEESDYTESEIKDPTSGGIQTNENEVSNKNVEEATPNNDDKESQSLSENISETDAEPSDVTGTQKDIEDEVKNETNGEAETASRDERIVKKQTENQGDIKSDDEPQNSSENKPETASETVVDDVEDVNIKEEISTDDAVSDDTEPLITITETIAESTSNGSQNDGITETSESKEVRDEDGEEEDAINPELKSDENEDEVEDGAVEEPEENEQNDTNEDVSEANEETESSNVEINEEEACNLNEECDQTSNRKAHAYTEEYNRPVLKEEELENEIEDTHLERVVKFFSSFLN